MDEKEKALENLFKVARRRNVSKYRRIVYLLQKKCLKLGVKIKDLEKLYAVISGE